MPGSHDTPDGPAGARPRVVFVEDEASISGPFSTALTREGFDPVVVGTLAAAREEVARHPPDLVLLDLMLPDGDGRDLARELRAASDVPIIMLTARGTELERVVGLELGADDYVVKPFSGAELTARMRAVLRRARPAAPRPGIVEIGPVRVDLPARRAWRDGAEMQLSRKEFDLLAELVTHAGQVVRREDLIARVWDENWFGSTKTLDVHIGWLRGKLADDAAHPELLHTVRGVGFRFAAPSERA